MCFDWLSCNMEVLRSCSQGCRPLVNRTATFLNYLIKVIMPTPLKTGSKNMLPITTSLIISSPKLQQQEQKLMPISDECGE